MNERNSEQHSDESIHGPASTHQWTRQGDRLRASLSDNDEGASPLARSRRQLIDYIRRIDVLGRSVASLVDGAVRRSARESSLSARRSSIVQIDSCYFFTSFHGFFTLDQFGCNYRDLGSYNMRCCKSKKTATNIQFSRLVDEIILLSPPPSLRFDNPSTPPPPPPN